MRELEEKRGWTSKTFDLGDGRFRIDVSRQPVHFQRGGKFVDIDLMPEFDSGRGHFVLRDCPYSLRVSDAAPVYLYNSLSGKRVEVELLVPSSTRALVEGGLFKWGAVGEDADYVIQPLPSGCATWLFLHSARAPRVWRWQVRGDIDLIRPLKGVDSAGRRLELAEHRNRGTQTIEVEWTGRAILPRRLRQDGRAVWSEEVQYPVLIDPTINENIGSGPDDAGSVWSNNGANFKAFDNAASYVYAGRFGGSRSYVGFRFQTIPIPGTASIVSATLTVYVQTVGGAPNINVYGNDVDDAGAFSSPANRIKNITKTSAVANKTSWTPNADNAVTVTDIVAEIVARAGWASNNDLALGFFNNAATGSQYINVAQFEQPVQAEARLSIEFTVAGGGTAANTVGRGLTESRFLHPRSLVKH